jgi:hypothetical protein
MGLLFFGFRRQSGNATMAQASKMGTVWLVLHRLGLLLGVWVSNFENGFSLHQLSSFQW